MLKKIIFFKIIIITEIDRYCFIRSFSDEYTNVTSTAASTNGLTADVTSAAASTDGSIAAPLPEASTDESTAASSPDASTDESTAAPSPQASTATRVYRMN